MNKEEKGKEIRETFEFLTEHNFYRDNSRVIKNIALNYYPDWPQETLDELFVFLRKSKKVIIEIKKNKSKVFLYYKDNEFLIRDYCKRILSGDIVY